MGASASTWGSGATDVPVSQTSGSAVAQPLVDVASTGTVSASGENSASGEGIVEAFDNNSRTKWLAFQNAPWIAIHLPAAKTVKLYTLTSGNDFPGRDPKSWTLQGSNNGTTWTTLDTRTGQDFPWRHQTRAFAITNTLSYSQYRLQVTENHGDVNTQLAEWELLGR